MITGLITGALAFAETSWGRRILGAVGLIVLLAIFYSWAHHQGKAECELSTLQNSVAIRAQVQKELRSAETKADDRSLRAERNNVELDKKVDEIIANARKTLPDDSVCLPADITDKLRALR